MHDPRSVDPGPAGRRTLPSIGRACEPARGVIRDASSACLRRHIDGASWPKPGRDIGRPSHCPLRVVNEVRGPSPLRRRPHSRFRTPTSGLLDQISSYRAAPGILDPSGTRRCGSGIGWRQAHFSLDGGQYGSEGGVRQPRAEAWSIRVWVARATVGRVSSAR
jgi:hypothetical protein